MTFHGKTPDMEAKMYHAYATLIALLVVTSSILTPVGQLPIQADEDFPRLVEFSGYTWQVNTFSSPNRSAPSNSGISSTRPYVYIDGTGSLHLSINYFNGKWWSTEAVLTQPLGYGTYKYHLGSPIHLADPSAVLATFIWDTTNQEELDIEFSRWGTARNTNSLYAVQPTSVRNNYRTFTIKPAASGKTVHTITWSPHYVYFQSEEVFSDGKSKNILTWKYTGPNIPSPDHERAVISYWVYKYGPIRHPSEFVIDKFEFNPLN